MSAPNPCTSIAITLGKVAEAIQAAERMPKGTKQELTLKALETEEKNIETAYLECLKRKATGLYIGSWRAVCKYVSPPTTKTVEHWQKDRLCPLMVPRRHVDFNVN
jgi:hypothetical protein